MTPEALNDAIDEFLRDYELLDAAYRNDLMDEDMAYDAFPTSLRKLCGTPR
jgi:hypothetical protein